MLTSLGNDVIAHLKLNIQRDTQSRSYGLGPRVLEMVKYSSILSSRHKRKSLEYKMLEKSTYGKGHQSN